MLRVISGSAGGLHLRVPKKAEIRPTQDRIKQAIFSSLGQRTLGAKVLDLYAGTGALGIEALSRGAHSATFVEAQKECVECIRENLTRCQLSGIVIQSEVMSFLVGPPEPRYDLVFADPPYVKQRGKTQLESYWIALSPHLMSDSIVLWEYCSAQEFVGPPLGELLWNRRYGETSVACIRWSSLRSS